MLFINNIKTGFTREGRYTPSTWTTTKLVTNEPGHTQSTIYKNIGTTSGYIEFDYLLTSTQSASTHSIFRIRSEYLEKGTYYDEDAFYGVGLFWQSYDNNRRLFLFENNGVKGNVANFTALHTFKEYTANKTIRIKFLWNKEFLYVSVGDEVVTIKNIIKDDYTYIDFGFSHAYGTVTRTIKNIPPPTLECDVIDDKLNIGITKNSYTVSSVDILYNNVIIETIPYSDSYIHTIEKDKLSIGKNKLSVRINSNFIIPITETIEFDNDISLLESNATLTDVANCIKSITSTNEVEYETLKSILINKNINISKEDKMIEVINKVEKLPSIKVISELQTSQRQIENKISILEAENETLKQELSITQDAVNELIFNSLNI